MDSITLEAEKRDLASKGQLATLRRNGRVPAVTYGDNEAPLAISVDEKSLQKAIHSERGRNALITLKIGTSSHAVLVKELQRNPISRAIRHIDFYRVSLKKKIEATVPIHVKGEATGVKNFGGVLEQVLREIKVKCLPTEIPSAIDVNITDLNIGQGVKAKDLQLPGSVELLTPADNVILHIVAPAKEEEPTPAAGAAATAAEPEVIKKGKTDEEGAAPAGDKKGAAPAAKPEAKK